MHSAGLLTAASNVFRLRVDPADQDARRALVEAVPELEERAAWIEALARRVSEGLSEGRYALLPSRDGWVVPTDKDADDGEAKEERTHSLTLHCLADLVTQPADALDAVWIDDRWIGRHQLAGATRITDSLEVLSSLEATNRISEDEHRGCILRLRAANVRVIPMAASEILYHLRAAPISDGKVVETQALRILRQHAAATLEEVGSLQVPSLPQLSRGEVGELEVLRAYAAAWRESIFEIWQSLNRGTGTSALARAEAQSTWIVEHLYVDPALIRGRAGPMNLGADLRLSAFAAAALLVSAIQLIRGDGGLTGEDESDAPTAYARWVYNAVLTQRVERDERFRAALVEHLRTILIDWAKSDADDDVSRATAHLLANRAFELLPAALQDLLAEDANFMATIGRAVVSSLNIGRWHLDVSKFASAAAKLLASPGTSADEPTVEIEVLSAFDAEVPPKSSCRGPDRPASPYGPMRLARRCISTTRHSASSFRPARPAAQRLQRSEIRST